MTETLYVLAILACPVGMGVMMVLMMRGGKSDQEVPSPAGDAELNQLRREVEELRAVQRDGSGSPVAASDRAAR